VSLRLCRFTGPTTFDLPSGIVVFLHHSVIKCPGNFSDFVDAHGRFLVFANATKDMSDGNLISPARAINASIGGVGEHTHSMPALPFTPRTRQILFQFAGPFGGQSTTPSFDVAIPLPILEAAISAPAHLNLPYIQLRACQVNAGVPTVTKVLPPASLIFFFQGNTCPALWREATGRTDGGNGQPFGNIAGRMIFNLYNNTVGNFAGQIATNSSASTLPCASGLCGTPGQAPHLHTVNIKNCNLPSFNSDYDNSAASSRFIGETK
jgi:hypothetical protein